MQLSAGITVQATVIFTYSTGCYCPHVPGSPVSCLNDSSVIDPRLHQKAAAICERLNGKKDRWSGKREKKESKERGFVPPGLLFFYLV